VNTLNGLDLNANVGRPLRVDGDTVFTAGPELIEDFESGNVNDWDVITGAGGGISISNDSFNGAHAGNVEVTSGGNACTAYFDGFGTRDFTKSFLLESFIKDNNDGRETNQGLGFLFDTSDPNAIFNANIGSRNGDPTFEIFADAGNRKASASPSIGRNKYFKIRLEHDGSNNYTATLLETDDTQISQISATINDQPNQSNAYVALTHTANNNETHSTNFDDIILSL
jgi:hypothetical protein